MGFFYVIFIYMYIYGISLCFVSSVYECVSDGVVVWFSRKSAHATVSFLGVVFFFVFL